MPFRSRSLENAVGARPRSTRILATAAVGLAVLAVGRQASAANYTITIDASKSASGLPRFWSAAVGTGTASLTLRGDLQTHYKLANRELGMQRVRGHGVLNDDMGIFHWTGGTAAPTYDWTNFDKYLAAIVAAGMRPLMELSFMPMALAKSGNSRDPAKDLNVYKQFIQAVVQHCVDKYGASDVGQWYWEVWNEPNYPGFWNGTFDDYLAMYDQAVAGATAALPDVLIGGPVTTPGSSTQIQQFLAHTKSANERVSFASSHAYPGGAGPSADATFGVTDNTTRLSDITGAGYTPSNVKSMNTEWNSSYSGQGGNTADNCVSMDSHVNAPFILKAVKLLADKVQGTTPPLDVFSYWVVSDVFGEYSGDSGSYIASKGGTLPFGEVFGLMTYQGVRKAAFNGFKMLNYLGTSRLSASGGTGSSDGVDALATVSAAGDEVEIIVYNYYATVSTTGSDSVTLTVSNLPFSGQAYVTEFAVDSTHSNPYGIWLNQNSPTNPTEAQWEAMRAAQHLMPVQPVSQTAISGMYTTTLTIPKQGAALVIVGKSRPLTGRNAFVPIEGEDYDGQSAVTKQDSGDTDLGQSIGGSSGSYVYFENVDFSDAGADAVALRVNAQSSTTLELRADSQTGPLLGTCQVAATGGAWATQMCMLTQTSGVHRLYVTFGGTVLLSWLTFDGAGADAGRSSSGGGSGGPPSSSGSTTSSGSGGAGSTGSSGPGASGSSGVGASGSSGAGSASGGSASGGSSGSGEHASPGASSGCGCTFVGGDDIGASAAIGAAALAVFRRRRRRI
jgi:xylan 1,4-beta-xylosidase